MVDPLDSGVGTSIEKLRQVTRCGRHRLRPPHLGGSRAYYVSFNNVRLGTLIGQGFRSCVTAWHVKKPQVVVMHGAATDNNATLFAQGYDAVIQPFFKTGKWTDVTRR